MHKTAIALAATLLLGACQRSDPPPPAAPGNADVNAGSSLRDSTSDTPTGQADSAEPETGTNIGRPDGPKDLKPGTDGNTSPPAQ